MRILLIVFENAIDVAMHALDERNVEIAAVVTAITPRMEERLQHYGLAERAVPYEQLDAALGEIDYNYIVFSEFGGGTEVADDLHGLRIPAEQQVNLTYAFRFLFAHMSMLMTWYYEHARDIAVAVIGSSYMYRGFDLNTFCRSAVNFSLASQDVFQGRCMLEKAFRAPACTLERVLIGLAPWSFESDASLRPNAWWQMWNYLPIAHSLHHIPIPSATVERLCKQSFLRRISERSLDLNDVLHLRLHDWEPEHDFVHAPLKRIQAKRGACAWNEKQYPATRREMKGELRKILELCEAHGAEPVLLITPFTAFYRRYLSPRLLTSFRESLAEVVQGRQVRVLDYYARPEFDEADFLDEQHLNAHGALKMTRLLNHDLYGVETPLPSAWRGRPARIEGDCLTVAGFRWNIRAGRELADVHLRPFEAAWQPERPVVIYGAGQDGRKLFQKLREAGIPEEELLFCDTYHAGAVVEGKTVLSPEDLCRYPEAPILISSAKYGSSIYDGLTARGIGDERLFYDP